MPHKGHLKNTRKNILWANLKKARLHAQDTNADADMEPVHLPVEVVKDILDYMDVEGNYSCDMLKLALVAKSWVIPALNCLYRNITFGSFMAMELYVSTVENRPHLGEHAQSITISHMSGPANPEPLLCRLMRVCPNVKFFYAGQCPPSWLTDAVLTEMSNHMKNIEKLTLHFRTRLFGRAMLDSLPGWSNLHYLELTDMVGLDEQQFPEVLKSVRNLKVLRMSRENLTYGFRDHICDASLRIIATHHTTLKVIEFNNCIRLSNTPVLECFDSLADNLECFIMTGCKQISGITLAKVIHKCDNLRFVNVSRSSFNDEALRYLAGLPNPPPNGPQAETSQANTSQMVAPQTETTPRICQWITHFSMSYCSGISLAPFQTFANVLGSRIREGHVSRCIIYAQGNRPNLHRLRIREIERNNIGLHIKCSKESFRLEEIFGAILQSSVPTLQHPQLDSAEARGGIAPDGLVKCGIRSFKLVVEPPLPSPPPPPPSSLPPPPPRPHISYSAIYK